MDLLGICRGFARDLRGICRGFAGDLPRICQGFAAYFNRRTQQKQGFAEDLPEIPADGEQKQGFAGDLLEIYRRFEMDLPRISSRDVREIC